MPLFKPLPTGAIVGTTDAQALSNKSLTPGNADALDLNTVTSPGWYSGNSNTNGPVSGPFFLEVVGNTALDANYLRQQFSQLNSGTFDVYYRARLGGSWSAWRKATLT